MERAFPKRKFPIEIFRIFFVNGKRPIQLNFYPSLLASVRFLNRFSCFTRVYEGHLVFCYKEEF